MKLFFDTETTGKADFRNRNPERQPRIVQIAAMLTEDDGMERASMSAIIQPDGWEIPAEAASIHGITTDLAAACGVPLFSALSMFNNLALRADCIIAHNIDFDHLVTSCEFERLRKPFPSHALLFCTMHATTQLCKLPGNYGDFKWPKLEEALRILCGKELLNAHDAMADVRGCAELYFTAARGGAQ